MKLCNGVRFSLDNVPIYNCEDTQYPPDLLVTIRRRQLRIILDFGGYYDEHDITELHETEKANGHGCIRFRFPECGDDEDNFFSRTHLKDVMERGGFNPVFRWNIRGILTFQKPQNRQKSRESGLQTKDV